MGNLLTPNQNEANRRVTEEINQLTTERDELESLLKKTMQSSRHCIKTSNPKLANPCKNIECWSDECIELLLKQERSTK